MSRIAGRLEKLEKARGRIDPLIVLHRYPNETHETARRKYELEHGPIPESTLVVMIEHFSECGRS